MLRIGIDAMGGDFAPEEAVKGALAAHQAHPNWELVLFGDANKIQPIFANQDYNTDKLIIVHTSQSIEMSEHPVKAFASKQDSSIVKGFAYLAQKKIDAFLSAGNTGAMLVGSVQIIKPIAGVQRPCLTSIIPRMNNHPGLLLDVGANSDVKPEYLSQFASLGHCFYKAVYGIEKPKVALLNIGEESEKGSILTKAAYTELAANSNINFVGNIESRDIFSDAADVVVCDGFTGNIIIKLCEGMYYRLAKRGIQDEFLDKFNFKHYGGSAILGVNAPVIVGHGITKADTFVKMIEMAATEVENNLVSTITNMFLSETSATSTN